MVKQLLEIFLLITLIFVPLTKCDIAEVLTNIANIDSYREKSYEKIISLKQEDHGWGYDTPRVIASLQLGDNSWASQNLPSVKQMQVELLSELLNDDSRNPMRSGRLAMFVYGLVATCQNPKHFHQRDLLEQLNSMPTYNSFELAYVSLALCVSGTKVDKNKIDLMVSYLHNFTAEETYMRDYIGMLLQAIECVAITNPSTKLHHVINKATNELKHSQNVDGSFGNIDTSAVVAQALLHATDKNWNASAIVYYFLNSQTTDGTIGNNAATVQIYPILYAKNYVDLRQFKCTTAKSSSATFNYASESTKSVIGNANISITYALWIGDDANQKIQIKLTVSLGLSFYEIMKIAARQDSRFKFEASESSYGHYVRSINGIRENFTNNTYWMLGVIKGNNKLPTISETGVDTYYPQDRDLVVFWYKTVNV